MGEKTGITWTDHTFNPWWGCEKVSPACTNCYAETTAVRWGHAIWGKDTPRRALSEHNWNDPVRWNKKAQAAGGRAKVFCASMADVFEQRADLDEWRARLWKLIEATPALDWLLLTKRPENVNDMFPDEWLDLPRPNVWMGTTVENQEWADKRIPALLNVDAVLYWLSCEPLLGPLDLRSYFSREVETGQLSSAFVHGIDWVITGGESGHGSRPFDLKHGRALQHQCQEAGIPFFMKQLGERTKEGQRFTYTPGNKMKDPIFWPEDFRVQEFPETPKERYE